MDVKGIVAKIADAGQQKAEERASDFEKLRQEHVQLSSSAMENAENIMLHMQELAKGGLLGSEFRPLLAYAKNAYLDAEQLRNVGKEMAEQYGEHMKAAAQAIDRHGTKKGESAALAQEIEETLRTTVGVGAEKGKRKR